MRRYTRPVAEPWPLWRARAIAGIHPFQFTLHRDVERVLTGLDGYDRDAWAAAFSAVAAPYRAAAEDAERAGDTTLARDNYLRAYGYYRMARYPTTVSLSASVFNCSQAVQPTTAPGVPRLSRPKTWASTWCSAIRRDGGDHLHHPATAHRRQL